MSRHPGRFEFIALMAMLLATVAFTIDAMLPALPEIAATLSPDNPNRAQLIVTAFVFGMGLGTFLAGPISDATGRKPAIVGGLALYIVGAILASQAQTLETLLAARLVQGLGAAAPRIVAQAMIRDRFEGRQMAQVMSFVMMVFLLVPAVSPAVGSIIIDAFGWRAIFGAFALFTLTGGLWLTIRQPETLVPADRHPMRAGLMRLAVAEVLRRADVRIYIAVLTLGTAQMFALVSSVQQIYDIYLGFGDTFEWWFMATAILSGTGTIVNAALVMRLGMRRIAIWAYGVQSLISLALIAADLLGWVSPGIALPVFFCWSVSVYFMIGLTFGNLNSLALQPLGHIAGMAASVIGSISTIFGTILAVPIGLAFDGTPLPLYAGTLVCSALAYLLMRRTMEAEGAPADQVAPGH
ncbi:multidrug effflux MFS transporter [Palleronia sp. LCG004]|uniref:multidrug effflux MFS transporter n=1 Tax=Palleronia sp. LCG004 TaxID=3079304 RepID=UPI002942DD1D|nr:multidrug effflux MFS transporter [Palleronia sp. LCG004]WOI57239.1 multidrug effflux MFS transporter [Palleronia sp. LCG004]